MRFWTLCAAAVMVAPVVAVVPVAAQEAATVSTVQQPDPISAAKSRATLLWAHDQAAWHTTDVMLAQEKRAKQAEKDALSTVRGWVVTPDAKGWLVVYYAPAAAAGDAPKAVFSAIWTGKGDKVVDGKWLTSQSYAWSAEQLALAQAAALVSPPMLQCSRANLNRVVMPDPAVSGQILVYYMTPQEKTGTVPFGRHSRTAVRDGAVTDRYNATKGCVIIPTVGSNGEVPPAIGVSNFTSDTPTEFHLFAARTARVPVVTMNKEDKVNYIVGWKKDVPFIEPISDIQDIDRFID